MFHVQAHKARPDQPQGAQVAHPAAPTDAELEQQQEDAYAARERGLDQILDAAEA